ncbi:MAG: hypothetical protein SFV55_03185 [Haliscomenobacter sp.]|uniref:MGH1-like glycoside hydrolase domain-containing protein n=1 Tax=Haliscomenobacter sp. TaxID=2717303 RepID=UPI0029A19E83|nr:hypothetical protein [Haliscomenobacter sp.]MDX2067401.1 hypothetical protein [Haliscomenobacter sp.]
MHILHATDDAFQHTASAMEQLALGLGYAHSDVGKVWHWLEQELSRQTEQGCIPQVQDAQICTPPFYSILAWACWKKDPSAARIEALFDALLQSHHYWYLHRDPQEMGLPCIHFAEETVLPEFFQNYHAPFKIQDPAFLGLLCRANECLIEMGEKLQRDLGDLIQWHELTVFGLNEDLWDDASKSYCGFDLHSGQKLGNPNLANYLPLWAGVPDQELAEGMCRNLIKRYFRDNYWLLPSRLPASGSSNETVSLLLNRIIYAGLIRYGFKENASYLRNSSLQMVGNYGFYKSYQALMHPYDNMGIGKGNSAVAAALVLDLANGIAEKRGFEQSW